MSIKNEVAGFFSVLLLIAAAPQPAISEPRLHLKGRIGTPIDSTAESGGARHMLLSELEGQLVWLRPGFSPFLRFSETTNILYRPTEIVLQPDYLFLKGYAGVKWGADGLERELCLAYRGRYGEDREGSLSGVGIGLRIASAGFDFPVVESGFRWRAGVEWLPAGNVGGGRILEAGARWNLFQLGEQLTAGVDAELEREWLGMESGMVWRVEPRLTILTPAAGLSLFLGGFGGIGPLGPKEKGVAVGMAIQSLPRPANSLTFSRIADGTLSLLPELHGSLQTGIKSGDILAGLEIKATFFRSIISRRSFAVFLYHRADIRAHDHVKYTVEGGLETGLGKNLVLAFGYDHQSDHTLSRRLHRQQCNIARVVLRTWGWPLWERETAAGQWEYLFSAGAFLRYSEDDSWGDFRIGLRRWLFGRRFSRPFVGTEWRIIAEREAVYGHKWEIGVVSRRRFIAVGWESEINYDRGVYIKAGLFF